MNEQFHLELNQGVFEGYKNKFKKRIYGLLCEKEKEKEGSKWEEYLDNLLRELCGFPEQLKTINYYILYFKMASLRYLRYEYFRSTIFECMNLFDNIGG